MINFKKGDRGEAVADLQRLLISNGYDLPATGYYGDMTAGAVKNYQAKHGLSVTGTVTDADYASIKKSGFVFVDTLLEDGEYYAEQVKKDTIYIHHTAGAPSAVNVINGWEHDRSKSGNRLPVATAYVIGGGMSGIPTMNGKIHRAFDDKYWAHHLGTRYSTNKWLNQKSVAIETCAWGQLTAKNGKLLTYVNTEVNAEDACKLQTPFRGFTYYHKYTENQLNSLKTLILYLANKYSINVKKTWTPKTFEMSNDAINGRPGIYSHTNIRADKNDMFPQPELLDMLNSL